ncbi:carboxylic acid reductase [Rhodococcus sp. G-MC3]|uniref:carboxylic acid reductase n=1 Tax=Rhodococcus sp. G-MC3 TaxID=3046209 RepID=UPI0024B9CD13|nr:carboxylic acid reductase [Rhodococcus sp. G-MC3]MDJ0392880.1 carboxylic acid reductase [Rhodococcus sp. G-MC3]
MTSAMDTRRQQRFAELHRTDEQFRAAEPHSTVADAAHSLQPNLTRIVTEIMERYSDRPALARRAREIVQRNGRAEIALLPRMETITYAEAWDCAGALAASLASGETRLAPGDFIATLGFAGVDYAVIELATIRLGAVSVPLQAGASARQLIDIARETEPTMLAADGDNLAVAVEIAQQCSTIRTILVLDHDDRADLDRERLTAARSAATSQSVVVEPVSEAISRGRDTTPYPLIESQDAERLATLIYTSGSTGTPKGAMHTERIVAESWAGAWNTTGPKAADGQGFPVVTLDYLPMSHLAGRALVFMTLSAGGTVNFTGAPDLSTLFEDFSLAKPTLVMLVPRVCEKIRHTAIAEIDRRLSASADGDPATVRDDVLTHFRNVTFGGRVLAAVVGTAPIAAEVKDFISELFDIGVQDNYGSTEAGMVLHDGVVMRPPVIDYRLEDVPELGYFSTDKPYPRGELLLATATIIPGYYKRPDVTAETFDADGFYRTGDVVAELAPDQLAYVDRRKNVLKLAQGEFVALARLEAAFGTSELVDQIFLYGNSQRSYLLAVVVPTSRITAAGAVTASLHTIARNEGLNSYEIPREVILAESPFTQENGLISGAGKQLRPKLVEKYGAVLEARYTDLEESRTDQLRKLRRRGPDAPILETVRESAHALLGCAGTDVSPEARFGDLGGDSLSALTFSDLLREIFDVEVPVGVVTGPSSDLRALADYIEARLGSTADTVTFDSVHGKNSSTVQADDLTLDAFLDTDTLKAAQDVAGPRAETRTVLLTGANGYLGRFLCLEWLQRMADVSGTVVCLVRGRDAANARVRLDAAFDSGDAELSARYNQLADAALEVVAGDIGNERLGLDVATWDDLAQRVDRIVHPAALVNHALPYHHMFGPNVVGTAEVIRLATADHLKPVTYLSTVAVAAGVENFVEDGDIRRESATRSVDESYANGYGTSKWAGEVLLRNAFDVLDLPVTVFRSDMILAHSTWSGQLNVPDVFTRLVLSVAATGLAPKSFYRTDTGTPTDDDGRPRAHYDGLPADFSAAAITALGGDAVSGYTTYDVLNPHDDGISLDTFVDWMIESGRSIERVDDYDEWFARFSTAIADLPELQRSKSLLPLLYSYEQPEYPSAGAHLPAEGFRAAVIEEGDGDIPHLGRGLIEKYLRDLEQLGLLAPA